MSEHSYCLSHTFRWFTSFIHKQHSSCSLHTFRWSDSWPTWLPLVSLHLFLYPRLATRGFMVMGSMYCVYRVLVMVAVVSLSLKNDCSATCRRAFFLIHLHQCNPRRTARSLCSPSSLLTISPLIYEYTDYGISVVIHRPKEFCG